MSGPRYCQSAFENKKRKLWARKFLKPSLKVQEMTFRYSFFIVDGGGGALQILNWAPCHNVTPLISILIMNTLGQLTLALRNE